MDADLFLLKSLHKSVLQSICMLRLQGLLLIGCHALLAEDPAALLLLPVGCEVRSALGTEERLHARQRPSEFTCTEQPEQHAATEYDHIHNCVTINPTEEADSLHILL